MVRRRWRLHWTNQSLLRLQEIGDFIAQRNPQAAVQTIEEIFARATSIQDHPMMGSIYGGDPAGQIRVAHFSPYRLYYVADKKTHVISILTLQHGKEHDVDPMRTP